MSKKQLGAAPEVESEVELVPGERLGRFARLRAQPGFRTAAVAFLLTVVLGVGGPAAYAYWSQSATGTISGTTRQAAPVPVVPAPTPSPSPSSPKPTPSPSASVPAVPKPTPVPAVPANTVLAGARPVLAARPSTPTGPSCAALLTHEQMHRQKYADIRFSWLGAARATSYTVSVRTNVGSSYVYNESKSVSGPTADFRFQRLESQTNGDAVGGASPFYTDYVVRVMPMNGSTAGDPLYFTYKYEHRNSNNCFMGASTGASPLGSVEPLACSPTADPVGGGYSDLKLSWPSIGTGVSYSVTLVNASRTYGGEVSVTGTGTGFRFLRPAPEADNAPYLGQYTVRVQPLLGTQAGDPVYRTYQLGKWSQECW